MRRYGWVPDVPDRRDHVYKVAKPVRLPRRVDLRAACPPVYDQGELGSCTANAIAAAIQFNRARQKLTPDFVPSRLFVYYNARVMEGTVASDAGAMIRDGIKSVAKQGDCPEGLWQYRVSAFHVKPARRCYTQALKYRALQYDRVPQRGNAMKQCLASGYPFVFGMAVYESFESAAVAEAGSVSMPGADEKLIGAHAVLAVGYDDDAGAVIVRNSWGTKWGIKGHFTLPYEYIADSNLADDLWTIKLVSA